jgi:hypothetical protein
LQSERPIGVAQGRQGRWAVRIHVFFNAIEIILLKFKFVYFIIIYNRLIFSNIQVKCNLYAKTSYLVHKNLN